MKKEIKYCEYCGKELKPLNPPIEEYIQYKFSIKVPFTDWKFMLLKDDFEYGCPDCLAEIDMERRRDSDEEIYYEGMRAGYEEALKELR